MYCYNTKGKHQQYRDIFSEVPRNSLILIIVPWIIFLTQSCTFLATAINTYILHLNAHFNITRFHLPVFFPTPLFALVCLSSKILNLCYSVLIWAVFFLISGCLSSFGIWLTLALGKYSLYFPDSLANVEITPKIYFKAV